MNEPRTIPFRWILPIAELLVCAVLLWPWRGFFIVEMRVTAHAHWPALVEQPVLRLNTAQGPETLRDRHAETLAAIRILTPALLNIPCSLLGLMRREAVPRGMLPEFWRSISWPFFGIVFWWIAGRGIEALVASRRDLLSPAITWIEVFVASLIIVLGVFIWLLFFSGDRAGFIFPWPGALIAGAMWILLGGATIAARVTQWRTRRWSNPDTAPSQG